MLLKRIILSFLLVLHLGMNSQNLAINKQVYVSSFETNSLLGSNAVDGIISTRWSSQFVEPSWIYIDLGNDVEINKVILRWEDAYAKKYEIQTSSNTNTWTTVFSENNSNGFIDEINFGPITTRYIRMNGIERATEYGFSLYEFEVYGTDQALSSSDASLSGIFVNNQRLSSFESTNLDYNYSLFPSVTSPPQISATLNNPFDTMSIVQSDSLNNAATISVVSADGSVSNVYTVNFYKPNFNNLVWFDEFNDDGNFYTSGINSPEISKWHHQIHPPNGHSWFNGEHQHYTNRIENSSVSNGTLRIKSKKETYTYNGSTKEYTSARINSKFSFLYGRVDIRAKLPSSSGTWPAFWTLGNNINEYGNYFGDTYGDVGWPACGEIDIMEQNGWDKSQLIGHLHWGDTQNGNYENFGTTTEVINASSSYNIYSLEWTKDYIAILINNIPFLETHNTEGMPYDNPHYLLLNIAMGGNLGGSIPESFTEDFMLVDYVRVFQESNQTANSISLNENKKIILFPNPAKKSFTIQSEIFINKILIYNNTGQLLISEPVNRNKKIIDFNLSKGTYFVKIISKNGISFKSFLIN